MSRRWHARRVGTGAWLHRDLPFGEAEPLEELSAPGSLATSIAPEVGDLIGSDKRFVLENWGTEVYLEEDGQIRWGGLVVDSGWVGPEWRIEAAGFSTYPHGMPFARSYQGVRVDPAAVVRMIWQHLQSYPGGNLGVEVVGSTPARIGTESEQVSFQTGTGDSVAFEAGPYRLDWEDTPDCGREIDALAAETPFDWVERHEWAGDDVRHWIDIRPRHGRRRTDLRFELGVNVLQVPRVDEDGSAYANEVIGIGAGEGAKALRRTIAQRDGRLRRARVATRKTIDSARRMDVEVRTLLAQSMQQRSIPEIIIRASHPHAEFAGIQLGDVIDIDATLPWLDRTSHTARVVGKQRLTGDRGRLILGRADGG